MPSPTPEDWARMRYAYEHSDEPIEDICAAYAISSGTLRDRMRRWGWKRRRLPIPTMGPAPIGPPPLPPAFAMAEPARIACGNDGHGAHERERVAETGEPAFRPDARHSETMQQADDPKPKHSALAEQPAAPTPDGNANAVPASRLDALPRAPDANAEHPPPHTEDAAPPPAYSRFIAQAAQAQSGTHDAAPLNERLRGAIDRIMPAIESTLGTLTSGPQQPRQMEITARALGALTRTLRELNSLLDQQAAHEPYEEKDMNAFRLSLAAQIDAIIRRRHEQIPQRYLAAWEECAARADATDAVAEGGNEDAPCLMGSASEPRPSS